MYGRDVKSNKVYKALEITPQNATYCKHGNIIWDEIKFFIFFILFLGCKVCVYEKFQQYIDIIL